MKLITLKCTECDFTVTKGQRIDAEMVMLTHWAEHPKKYLKIRNHNEILEAKIQSLKNEKLLCYYEVP